MLGALGALGVGAYLMLNNKNGGLGGAGGGGGGNNPFDPAQGDTIFNIFPPTFPDLSGFFTDNPPPATAEVPTSKKAATTPNTGGLQVYLPGSNEPLGSFAPGDKVIVPNINTIPNTTGGQNFPTIVVPTKKTSPLTVAPSAGPPLQIQNVFGFPVVPHLTTTAPVKKATVVTPSTGNQAALITTGTPAQQIAQYNVAPRIYKGKKVM